MPDTSDEPAAPMTTPTAAEPDEPRYTQGIMGDGAAILDDGVLLTVEEILDRLNAPAMAPSAPADIVALVDDLQGAQHVLSTCERMYVTGFKDRRNLARTALLTAIGRMGRGTAPEDWRLVPIKPTPEMMEAAGATPGMKAVDNLAVTHFARTGHDSLAGKGEGSPLQQAWRAMLGAAPPPPLAGEPVEPSHDALREAHYCLEQLRRIQGWEDPSDADEEQSNWSVYQRMIKALEGFEQTALVSAQPRPEVAGEREARLERCLGFFASVIKSGEPWTEACQREYDAARALGPTDRGDHGA